MKTRKTDRIISKVMLVGLVGLSFSAFASAGGDFLSKLMAEGKAMVNGTFQSDGSKVFSTEPLFSITPPQGWTVTHGPGGNSPTLIMQEPEQKFVKGSNDPIFRRNITVSLIQESAPIDDVRVKSFKEELEKKFGSNSMARSFQVIETRFGNWKGTKDAIIAYASWLAGDIQMMQMHVLVSGKDQQYMMSYTDMASRFLPESEQMTTAWNTMMSLDLDSVAPSRYTPVIIGSAITVSVLSLLLLVRSMRRRRHYHILSDESMDPEALKSEFHSQLPSQFAVAKPTPVNDRLPEFDPISMPNSNPVSQLPVKILRTSREEKSVKLARLKMQSEPRTEAQSILDLSSNDTPKHTKASLKMAVEHSASNLSELVDSKNVRADEIKKKQSAASNLAPSAKVDKKLGKASGGHSSMAAQLSEISNFSKPQKVEMKNPQQKNKDKFSQLDKSVAKSIPMDSINMDSWPLSARK